MMIIGRIGGMYTFLIEGGERKTINGRKWFCCDLKNAMEIPFLDNWTPTSINMRMNGDYRNLEQREIDEIFYKGLIDFYTNMERISGLPVTFFLNENFGDGVKITCYQGDKNRKLCMEYFDKY